MGVKVGVKMGVKMGVKVEVKVEVKVGEKVDDSDCFQFAECAGMFVRNSEKEKNVLSQPAGNVDMQKA